MPAFQTCILAQQENSATNPTMVVSG